jgi:hypothetical protein
MKTNALNFFNVREVRHNAPHFETVNLETTYNFEESIKGWIERNLKGRYYIGKTMILDSGNQYQNRVQIGFESPKELSYFMLACPHLKY